MFSCQGMKKQKSPREAWSRLLYKLQRSGAIRWTARVLRRRQPHNAGFSSKRHSKIQQQPVHVHELYTKNCSYDERAADKPVQGGGVQEDNMAMGNSSTSSKFDIFNCAGAGDALVTTGMGEVDVRAEMFIRKFKAEMRLQRPLSSKEFRQLVALGF